MRPLHIGLNCYFLKEDSGGSGTYTRELIRGIRRVAPESRFTLYATRDLPESFTSEMKGDDLRIEFLRGSVVRGEIRFGLQAIAAQWLVEPVLAARSKLDVLHSLAYVGAPLSSVPTVVSILDLIWHHYPGAMSPRNTAAFRALTHVSARRADRVIAISDAAKADLVDTFGIPAKKIDVTLLGAPNAHGAPVVASRFVRERYGIGPERYILCAAQKRIHKNLTSLVAALPHLASTDVKVVLTGSPTPYEAEVRALARRLGVEDRVVLPDWVPEEDLNALFAEASVFVLPSLMEGFGLPILEAMARGVPVACSDTSSLPEVAGDAALLFDPYDPRSIATQIDRILGDPDLAAALTRRGYARCEEITWDATARATLASYERAIEARG